MESYKCFLKCFSNGIGCEARSMLREHQKRDEKRFRSGKTRTLAIKKKITNKQTSENIYKLIPGKEKEREREILCITIRTEFTSFCMRSIWQPHPLWCLLPSFLQAATTTIIISGNRAAIASCAAI